MLSSMRRLLPAVLLLSATAAFADSPLPGADVPVREIVTRTSAEAPKADEQLGTLTREVKSLESDVQALQAKVNERAMHEVEFLDQSTHPLWP